MGGLKSNRKLRLTETFHVTTLKIQRIETKKKKKKIVEERERAVKGFRRFEVGDGRYSLSE